MRKPPPFELWFDNELSFSTFLNCSTQWRVSDGIYTGLDYKGVEVVLSFIPASRRSAVFADIQIMERATMPLLNKRDKHGPA